MIDSTSVADTPSENIATSRQSKQSKANMSDTAIQKICHANRCRLLLAKGLLRKPMQCAKGRNMCSGCICESTRHRKIATLELEILEATATNEVLAPLLAFIKTPVSIKMLRQALKHLPTMNYNKRDDSIFGVARYLANTLGFSLSNAADGTIDEPMLPDDINKKWREATFSCKCLDNGADQKIFGQRAFCTKCSFLTFHLDTMDSGKCPACLTNPPWNNDSHPCLACQFATMVFRNRFMARFQKYLEH